MNASSLRKPKRCSARISNTSSAVISDARDQRQPEQQFERDRGAEHFGQVAGDDRDLAQEPQHDVTGRL